MDKDALAKLMQTRNKILIQDTLKTYVREKFDKIRRERAGMDYNQPKEIDIISEAEKIFGSVWYSLYSLLLILTVYNEINMKDAEMYETKDKQLAPFLLTQKAVTFIGTRKGEDEKTVYFQFKPYKEAAHLVNLFYGGKADPIQPKVLLDALETFRDLIFGGKDG